jgi:polysaccharide biosynthesis protein PslG
MTRAAVAALCVLLAGCGGAEKKPKPPERSAFVGVVSEDTFEGDPGYRQRTLERQAAVGIGLVRQPFYWGLVETSRAHFDFSKLDAYVAAAGRERMRLLPVLFGAPDFRSSAPPPGSRARGTYPPSDPADFARYAEEVVRRYGPGGSFWERHDGLPITSWQIWNEPNLPVFWASGPDPAAYTRLLTAAAGAIHRADPRAQVVSAGLSQSRLGAPFESFLRGMYEAGAGDALDALAVHPYAPDAAGTVDVVRSARRLLRQLGRSDPIWVTELGWASGGPPSRFTTDEAGQAARVRAAVRALSERRSELGIAGIVYYDWRDKRPSPEQGDFFGLHTGLLRADGSAKPALGAFADAARAAVRNR